MRHVAHDHAEHQEAVAIDEALRVVEALVPTALRTRGVYGTR